MAERASKIDLSVDNIDDVLTAQINLASAANSMRLAYFLDDYAPSAAALHLNDAAKDIEGALDALGLVAVPKADADPLRDAAPDLLAALEEAELTLEQVCEGQHPDNVCCHHLRTARTAIAKAKGGADV